MDFIQHDHSGQLRKGVFYRLAFGDYSRVEIGDDWYNIPGDNDFYVEVTDARYETYQCKFGHEHRRMTEGRFDLQSGNDVPLYSAAAGFYVLSDSANRTLMGTGLDKFESVQLLPERGSVFQKRLWTIRADRFPIDKPLVIDGRPPLCPVCKSQLQCEHCGDLDSRCSNCGIGRVRFFSTYEDLRKSLGTLNQDEIPAILRHNTPVVDGSKWNGEDVVQLGSMIAVSRRFLGTFEALGFGAVHCPPISVWVDNCSTRQLELLDLASSSGKVPVK